MKLWDTATSGHAMSAAQKITRIITRNVQSVVLPGRLKGSVQWLQTLLLMAALGLRLLVRGNVTNADARMARMIHTAQAVRHRHLSESLSWRWR
jgi:hypothetical protein